MELLSPDREKDNSQPIFDFSQSAGYFCCMVDWCLPSYLWKLYHHCLFSAGTIPHGVMHHVFISLSCQPVSNLCQIRGPLRPLRALRRSAYWICGRLTGQSMFWWGDSYMNQLKIEKNIDYFNSKNVCS